MRLRHILFGTTLISVLSLGLLGGIASAHEFRTGTNVNLAQNQSINSTLFVSGRTIDVSSEVFGDVFCAGQNITISAVVHGDVICAGQTINISGQVQGDIRVAAQTITVSGTIGGNATVGGQSFTLSNEGSVDGDISLGTSDGTINGTVGRDIAAGGSQLNVGGAVGRNIKASAERMALSANANVRGDIALTSPNELNRENGSQVGGTVSRTEPQKNTSKRNGAMFGFSVVWFLYWFIALLILALALALIAPALIHHASTRTLARPWKTLLVGFLSTILTPIALVVLGFSAIGLPLAFVGGLAWLLVLALSGPFFGYYIGRLILRGSSRPLVIMLAGSAVLLILYFIPIIGFLVALVAVWMGSGMIVMEVARRMPRPTYVLPAETGTSATDATASKKPQSK